MVNCGLRTIKDISPKISTSSLATGYNVHIDDYHGPLLTEKKNYMKYVSKYWKDHMLKNSVHFSCCIPSHHTQTSEFNLLKNYCGLEFWYSLSFRGSALSLRIVWIKLKVCEHLITD